MRKEDGVIISSWHIIHSKYLRTHDSVPGWSLRPACIVKLPEKASNTVEISSSCVIHFQVVSAFTNAKGIFEAYPHACKVARKPPESSSKTRPNALQSNPKAVRKAAPKLFQGRPGVHSKQPQSCSKKVVRAVGKVGPRRFCAGYLAGLFLCLRPRF